LRARARQTSNAYAFSELAQGLRKPDYRNWRENREPEKVTDLGIVPVPLPSRLQFVLRSMGRSMGLTDAELQKKLE
jgi:hypothetical protein